ncbi:hypothetical protein AC578_1403 [Pseudocercospora eumusae]|uniref:Cytochrome c oxidase assembly factor 3 n=1 Tax=Pseudocercospora eumusae TaxID=321146 RepID=A0A139HUA8_9PEZI|nr:hypothetical protein AC578_1403 [Pseudocercospora eumusae]
MPLGRIPQSSYYDHRNRPTAALYRARHPYLIRNAVTGLCIVGLTAGIYVYTLKAIGQDDFSDVPIPDKPVEQAAAPHSSVVKSAGKE